MMGVEFKNVIKNLSNEPVEPPSLSECLCGSDIFC